MITRDVKYNHNYYTVVYDDCDSWLDAHELAIWNDACGKRRVYIKDSHLAVLPRISGMKQATLKNGNCLDLRRANICKPDYNRFNAPTKSGYQYIYPYHGKGWVVHVYVGAGKAISGKTHIDLDSAVKARNKILKKIGKAIPNEIRSKLQQMPYSDYIRDRQPKSSKRPLLLKVREG